MGGAGGDLLDDTEDQPLDCRVPVAGAAATGQAQSGGNATTCWTATWSTTRNSTVHESIRGIATVGFKAARYESRDEPFEHNNRTFRWSTNVYV